MFYVLEYFNEHTHDECFEKFNNIEDLHVRLHNLIQNNTCVEHSTYECKNIDINFTVSKDDGSSILLKP